MAGLIGNKFCTYNTVESGNGQQGEHFDARLSRGNVLGFKGVNLSSKFWGMPRSPEKKIEINFLKIKCTNRYNDAAMIPSEAG